jgi:membrane-associated phospholipid phosphatase
VQQLSVALLVPALTLGVVTLTLSLAALAGMPVGRDAVMHALLLAGYGAFGWFLLRIQSEATRTAAAGLLVIAAMFTLYTTLGHVAFAAIPWGGDDVLRAADRLLALGAEPTLWLSNSVAPSRFMVEAFAFYYAAYIPYLYVSIFLTLVGRPVRDQTEFVMAFGLLYSVAFMGYLFVPARGPVVAMAGDFAGPLNGGYFLQLVVASIDRLGGPHGAFPSLHVGSSLLLCLYDFRRGDPLRGLIYVPLVAMIALATVALRYHYVVDLVAGSALALLSLSLAAWLGGHRRGA